MRTDRFIPLLACLVILWFYLLVVRKKKQRRKSRDQSKRPR